MTEQTKRRSPSKGGIGITLYCARDEDHMRDVDVMGADLNKDLPPLVTVMREAGWAIIRGRVLCPACLAELGYDEWGEKLSDAVLDGRACRYCERQKGEMVPDAYGPRGDLFAHPECQHEDGE